MPNPSAISTLGDLRRAIERGDVRRRNVHEEVRDNLIEKLRAGGTLFPGIVGYDETVVPQLVNALLSRHHFISVTSARSSRVLAWPRRPSRMKWCRESSALTSWGTTVSS